MFILGSLNVESACWTSAVSEMTRNRNVSSGTLNLAQPNPSGLPVLLELFSLGVTAEAIRANVD